MITKLTEENVTALIGAEKVANLKRIGKLDFVIGKVQGELDGWIKSGGNPPDSLITQQLNMWHTNEMPPVIVTPPPVPTEPVKQNRDVNWMLQCIPDTYWENLQVNLANAIDVRIQHALNTATVLMSDDILMKLVAAIVKDVTGEIITPVKPIETAGQEKVEQTTAAPVAPVAPATNTTTAKDTDMVTIKLNRADAVKLANLCGEIRCQVIAQT